MKKIFTLFLLFLVTCTLSSCGTVAISPTGQLAPVLHQPIPKTNTILVVAALGGKATLVNESSFIYYHRRNLDIINLSLNASLAQLAAADAQALGYSTKIVSVDAASPLFKDSIQTTSSQILAGMAMSVSAPGKGSLTDTAKQALVALNQSIQAKIILLVARDSNLPFYLLACDKQGIFNGYYYSMVYLIDAQTYKILAWEKISPQFQWTEADPNACKNMDTLSQSQVESTFASSQSVLNQNVSKTVKRIFTITE